MVFLGCNREINPKSSVLRRFRDLFSGVQKSSIAYFNIGAPENAYLSKKASLDKLSIDACVLTKCVLENDGFTRALKMLEPSDGDHEEDQH